VAGIPRRRRVVISTRGDHASIGPRGDCASTGL